MKNNRVLKIISVCLILLLVLSACDNAIESSETTAPKATKAEKTSETDTKDKTDEIITLTIMDTWSWLPTVTSDTYILKLWGDAVGVVFEPTQVPNADYATKLSTLIASGNISDILYLGNSNIWKEYGPQGTFANITQAAAEGKLPNLAVLLDEFPNSIEKAADGNCYGIPTFTVWKKTNVGEGKFTLRRDILEQIGYDVSDEALNESITTVDELTTAVLDIYEYMNKGKTEKEPIIANRRGLNGYIVRAVAKFFGSDLQMTLNNDNEYILGPLYDNYRITLEFLNTLYTEGVLHPAWATMAEDEQNAWNSAGKYGIWTGPLSFSFANKAKTNEAYAGAQDYNVIPPIINGERAKIRTNSLAFFKDAINGKSDNLDAAYLAIDYAYSEEGSEILALGEEGYAWVYDDTSPWNRRWILNVNGKYPVDEKGEVIGDRSETRGIGIGFEPFSYMAPRDMWGIDQLMYYYDHTLENIYAGSEFIEDMIAANTWNDTPAKPLTFTQEEADTVKDISTPVYTYINEETLKFINDARSFDTWDEFVQQILDLGGKDLESAYNAANNR